MVSNILPQLGDDSGAIASRIITYSTRRSFLGNEDPQLLASKLLPERAGIMRWALDGLKRLRGRGYFEDFDASKEMRMRLANLSSPTRAFVVERCQLGNEFSVEKDALYRAWCYY